MSGYYLRHFLVYPPLPQLQEAFRYFVVSQCNWSLDMLWYPPSSSMYWFAIFAFEKYKWLSLLDLSFPACCNPNTFDPEEPATLFEWQPLRRNGLSKRICRFRCAGYFRVDPRHPLKFKCQASIGFDKGHVMGKHDWRFKPSGSADFSRRDGGVAWKLLLMIVWCQEPEPTLPSFLLPASESSNNSNPRCFFLRLFYSRPFEPSQTSQNFSLRIGMFCECEWMLCAW